MGNDFEAKKKLWENRGMIQSAGRPALKKTAASPATGQSAGKRMPPPVPKRPTSSVQSGHGVAALQGTSMQSTVRQFVQNTVDREKEQEQSLTKKEAKNAVAQMDTITLCRHLIAYYGSHPEKLKKIQKTKCGKILEALITPSKAIGAQVKKTLMGLQEVMDARARKMVELNDALEHKTTEVMNIIKEEGFQYYAASMGRKLEQRATKFSQSYLVKPIENRFFGRKKTREGTDAQLGSKEEDALRKANESDEFHGIVQRVHDLGELSDTERNAGIRSGAGVDGAASVAQDLKSVVSDPTTGLLGVIRKTSKVGEIGGLVIDGVELICRDVKYFLMNKIRTNEEAELDERGIPKEERTSTEKWSARKTTLNLIGQHIKYLGNIMSTSREVLQCAGPIGQLISSVILGLPKMYFHLKSFNDSRKSVNRMRGQKDAVKAKLYLYQKKNPKIPRIVRKRVDDTYAIEYKGQPMDKEGIDQYIKNLKSRWDADIHDSSAPAEKVVDKADFIATLEDYAITKELTLAGKNRKRDGIFNLVVDDLGGIIASVVMLAGPASPAGGILSLVLSSIKGARTIGKYTQQLFRTLGWFGTDPNKTSPQKFVHRHHLATLFYDRLHQLYDTEETLVEINKKYPVSIESMPLEDVKTVRAHLPARNDQRERMKATGLDMNVVRNAKNKSDMLDLMRSGFYADHE